MEKTKISYACLAKVVRDGGFKIALIARLSAIPGHCVSILLCFLSFVTLIIYSYHCGILYLRNECLRFFYSRYPFAS